MKKLNQIFKVKKPIIGMLHLDYLAGSKEFKSIDYVINKAIKDIQALEEGGIDGIIIENWKEDSIGEFVSTETASFFEAVCIKLAKYIHVPFGINVLNNDYKVALSVAKLTKASFVELDVFVDHVISDFIHSPIASKNPFEIKVTPKEIKDYAKKIGAQNIPLYVFVQPKHYKMIDKNKPIETSVRQAIDGGAAAILITKETGTAPTLDLIKKAKSAAGNTPVGIGSGLSAENAAKYLLVADFAVVGSSIKLNGDVDNPVDLQRVQELIKVSRKE